MREPSLVCTILVHYNEPEKTSRCIQTLTRVSYAQHQILVVDNGSKQEALEALKSNISPAHLIESGDNLGFTGGNNIAFEEARKRGASYVFLLNSDATVEPSVINDLVQAIESDPSIAMVGPRVHSLERPEYPLYAGGNLDLSNGESTIRRPRPTDQDRLVDVDWIPGCALFVRMSALEKVGGLNEDYFLYFEETDWCLRMREAGFRVVLLSKKLAYHSENESNALKKSAIFCYYYTRNHPRLVRRHGRLLTWLRFLPRYLYRSLIFRGALYFALGYLKGRDPLDRRRAKAFASGVWHGFLGRSGRGPNWLHSS